VRELRGGGISPFATPPRECIVWPWETSEMLDAKSDQEVRSGKGGELFSDSSRFLTKMSYSDTSFKESHIYQTECGQQSALGGITR